MSTAEAKSRPPSLRRALLLLPVVVAIVAFFGLGYGQYATPDALAKFLAPLADAGVDIFHCSTRRFWEPEFEGSTLNLAGWTKRLIGKPVMTVGSIGLDNDMFATFGGQGAGIANIDRLIEMVEHDEVDLVAVGRALLADPAWAAKIRDGRLEELEPFAVETLKVLT